MSEDWQPIESSPRDGRPIRAWCIDKNANWEGERVIMFDKHANKWVYPEFCSVFKDKVTHWKPCEAGPNNFKAWWME